MSQSGQFRGVLKEKMTVQKSVLPDELINKTDKLNFEVPKLPGKMHGL